MLQRLSVSDGLCLFCGMQFRDVIGQSAIKQQLVNLREQNRLSHALLVLGKEGSGGLPLAIAFAQYLVCEQGRAKPTETSPSLFGDPEPVTTPALTATDSCGVCPACQKAAQLIHPDIHFSYPVIPKKSGDKPVSNDYIKQWREFVQQQPYGNRFDWLQFIGAENQQGNITAAECHEIIRKMSLKSFEAPYKILILWMPELLGQDGNRLLKLIEEPPPDTLFLFVAENDEAIIQTILSRLQLIKIPRLSVTEIANALQEREKLDPVKATQIAAISEGNYHEALQQLQHADDDWDKFLRSWLNTIFRRNRAEQVKWIEDISKTGREKQKQFLAYFTHLLELAIRDRTLGLSLPVGETISPAVDMALRLNKQLDVPQLEAIAKELDHAAYYIERNANAKILFHALTIKLYHIISNKSVILMP